MNLFTSCRNTVPSNAPADAVVQTSSSDATISGDASALLPRRQRSSEATASVAAVAENSLASSDAARSTKLKPVTRMAVPPLTGPVRGLTLKTSGWE